MVRAGIRTVLCAFLLATALSSTAEAFDGHRGGFILGVGGGLNYTTFAGTGTEYSGESWDLGRYHHFGVVMDLKLGGGTDNFLLYWKPIQISWAVNHSASLFTGFGFDLYLEKEAPSFFLTLSGGLGGFGVQSEYVRDPPFSIGWALSGGVGYEFAKHYGVELNVAYYQGSNVNFDNDPDLNCDAVSVSLKFNFLAY